MTGDSYPCNSNHFSFSALYFLDQCRQNGNISCRKDLTQYLFSFHHPSGNCRRGPSVCVLFLSAVIITAFLAVKPHKNRYLFLYILLPLLAFPVTYFSLRIHKERKEDQYFFHYLSRTEKILHDSRCSKEKKMEFIRSCRENFPVTYEKPLWKNINSFPEKFEKGLEK